MSSTNFQVHEYTLPCTHIREYALATADCEEDVLNLAIKQYIPKDNTRPRKGDVTIIAAHANGFPKELYEPLWDEVYRRLKASDVHIRGIWIADVAHQGQSSVLNEDKLGRDPSWFDHPRDLFLMINHFRAQMPQPLVGIGHSMGAAHLTSLSLMHPRLLRTVVLIDPVIMRDPNVDNYALGRLSARRRDRWPSRAAAKTAFLKSPMFKAWDSRVLDLWVEHALRELPTAIYPEPTPASATPPAISADVTGSTIEPTNSEKEVTLKTTKHQEVMTFMRSNLKSASNPHPESAPNLLTHPDIDTSKTPTSPFYRSESLQLFAMLPFLRPSVLYVFGTESNLSAQKYREDKMAVTGLGVGGNGGAVKGRVQEYLMKGGSHLMPMERVEETADQCNQWLLKELAVYKKQHEEIEAMRNAVPRHKRAMMTDEFVRAAQETGKPKGLSKL